METTTTPGMLKAMGRGAWADRRSGEIRTAQRVTYLLDRGLRVDVTTGEAESDDPRDRRPRTAYETGMETVRRMRDARLR